jgi:uncharacterized membrane protein YraQ (UPF0718 family)
VVPIIAGLLLSGVPLAPVMSFWIASPTMDPEIFALSVGVLGWPLALARLGATLVLSLAAGCFTLVMSRASFVRQILPARETCCSPPLPTLQPALAIATSTGLHSTHAIPNFTGSNSCGGSSCPIPASHQAVSFRQIEWTRFWQDVLRESWSLGRWLLVAFLMEALIIRYIPQTAVAAVLGADNAWAVPLAALIGVPMYVNNIGALPIVAGLLTQGMQPGAAIAFLIAGPVTTIPAITAVWGVTERRVFLLYLGLGLLGAVIMGTATNLVLG